MKKEIKSNFNLSSLISHLSSRDGFTLIELLVVILVILSVGVLISSVLFSALRGANKTNTIDLVRRNGNSAITQMSRMIRYSQSFDGVSTDGIAYTTSCVPPIAASSAPVISAPSPRLGLFPKLANLIQRSFNLGEREVSFLFSKLPSLIPTTTYLSKLPKDPKQAGVFVYLAGLFRTIFLETFQNVPTEVAAQSASFPVVETTATSLETVAVTSHDVSLPAGIVSGNLLIVLFTVDGNPAITWPAGWTQFFNVTDVDGIVTLAAAYRKADGMEGATIIVTTGGTAIESAHHAYRIFGMADPATQAPQASVGATGIGTTPDPDSLTPSGGAKDYLWLAVGGMKLRSFATAPTNYTTILANNSGGAPGVGAGSARRTLNAASENPGTFAASGNDTWVAATIAVHPGAPLPTPTPTIPPPTPTPTTPPGASPTPTPTPIPYHYAQVTGFDGGKTVFRCDATANFSLGIASNSASLIDTSSVDVSSCYFTCSQDNIFSPPNIGINFSLTQKGNPQFFENKDSASFQTSVSVRNY